MARITDEDCIIQVPNRFELVVLAAQRAKQIAARSPITVERDNDKNTVVALREIAGPTIDLDNLRSSLVDLHRQYVQSQSHDDDLDDFLTSNRSYDDSTDTDDNDEEPQETLLDEQSNDGEHIDIDDSDDINADEDESQPQLE